MFIQNKGLDLKHNNLFASSKISIIVSDWNNEITELLYDGALTKLLEHGVKEKNIKKYNVAGSMELVFLSQYLLNKHKNLSGIISLGCIIKGETDHDKYIAYSVSKGLMDVSLKFNKPVIFGVLTTNNKKQAFERSGGKFGNKGEESSLALLKTLKITEETNSK